MAYIRHLAIGARCAGPGMFIADYPSPPRFGESIGHQKRVLVQLLNLNVVQVRGITFVDHPGQEVSVNRLIQQQRIPVVFQPPGEGVIAAGHFVINLRRDFHQALRAHLRQPFPELGNAFNWIVVAVGVNQHIRIQEVKHGYLPNCRPASSSGCTCPGLTPSIRAAFPVESASAAIIRCTRVVRRFPRRWRRTR